MKVKTRRLMQEAMALSIPPDDSRSLVLMPAYFVVVFSIFVQSLTVDRVIRMNGGPPVAPQSSAGR